MYHKIRDLMSIKNDGVRLDDIVEMDSTQIDVSMRKCQVEAKSKYKPILELDRQIEKYSKSYKVMKLLKIEGQPFNR